MKPVFEFIGGLLALLGLWGNYNYFTEKTIKGTHAAFNQEGFFSKLLGSLVFSIADMFAGIAIGVGSIVDSWKMVNWGYEMIHTTSPYTNNIQLGTKLLMAGLFLNFLGSIYGADNASK